MPSYTDLIVKLAAIALEHHPALNAALGGRLRWSLARTFTSVSRWTPKPAWSCQWFVMPGGCR